MDARNQIMELSKYLKGIGIITDSTSASFNTISSKQLENSDSWTLYQLLNATLTTYLTQLTSDFIMSMSDAILSNYMKIKVNSYQQILYKTLIVYSKNELKKLNYFFQKWKVVTDKCLPSSKTVSNRESYTNSLTNSNNKFKLNKNINRNSEEFANSKSLNLNRNNSSKRNKNELINSDQRRQQLKHNKSANNFKIKKDISNNNKVNSELICDFMTRQKKFMKEHSIHNDKRLKKKEENFKNVYTFNPKINQSGKNIDSNTPAHMRLYNDGINRLNKKVKEKENGYKTQNKKYDKEKIEHLYYDYKLRKLKNKKLMSQLDEERGYTFFPRNFKSEK